MRKNRTHCNHMDSMAPKDVLTWVSILGAFAVGLAAHFGVAAQVGDAEQAGAHTRDTLLQFMAESRDVHRTQATDAKESRDGHIRDVEQLRMSESSTRERVIVLEQSTRAILDGQQKMQHVLEASTVLVPSAPRAGASK